MTQIDKVSFHSDSCAGADLLGAAGGLLNGPAGGEGGNQGMGEGGNQGMDLLSGLRWAKSPDS